MRLDMSSPSLFVLSPVVTAATTAAANNNAGSGGGQGEGKTVNAGENSPGGGGGGNTNSSGNDSIRPARQKRSLRESPLKANSANSACLNQGWAHCP